MNLKNKCQLKHLATTNPTNNSDSLATINPTNNSDNVNNFFTLNVAIQNSTVNKKVTGIKVSTPKVSRSTTRPKNEKNEVENNVRK